MSLAVQECGINNSIQMQPDASLSSQDPSAARLALSDKAVCPGNFACGVVHHEWQPEIIVPAEAVHASTEDCAQAALPHVSGTGRAAVHWMHNGHALAAGTNGKESVRQVR